MAFRGHDLVTPEQNLNKAALNKKGTVGKPAEPKPEPRPVQSVSSRSQNSGNGGMNAGAWLSSSL